MIQCQITIDVKPECFKDWEPADAVAFFQALVTLVKIKEHADAKPALRGLADMEKVYKDCVASLRRAEAALVEARADVIGAAPAEAIPEPAAADGEVGGSAATPLPPEGTGEAAPSPRPEVGLKELPRRSVAERREAVVAFLAARQPCFPGTIAAGCGIPKAGPIHYTLKHPWFVNTQGGFALSPEGEAEARRRGLTVAPREEMPAANGTPQPPAAKLPEAAPPVPPPVPAPTPSPASAPTTDPRNAARRESVVREIARNGPATAEDVALALDVPTPAALALLRHPWFAHEDGEWRLTDRARKESKTLTGG